MLFDYIVSVLTSKHRSRIVNMVVDIIAVYRRMYVDRIAEKCYATFGSYSCS